MFDHFGLLAPFYEVFIRPKFPETLSDILQMPEGGKLLDVGGGTGRVSQFFAQQSSQVIVCDISLPMLQQSTEKEGIAQVNALSERIPYPDHAFERVIMVDALHHVMDQQDTAHEMWRVLKPGGRIVIEEPNHHHWAVKIVAWAEKALLMRSHFLNPRQITELFQSTNSFMTIHEEGYNVWITIHKPESTPPDSPISRIE